MNNRVRKLDLNEVDAAEIQVPTIRAAHVTLLALKGDMDRFKEKYVTESNPDVKEYWAYQMDELQVTIEALEICFRSFGYKEIG